jgi:hypothetical protein
MIEETFYREAARRALEGQALEVLGKNGNRRPLRAPKTSSSHELLRHSGIPFRLIPH